MTLTDTEPTRWQRISRAIGRLQPPAWILLLASLASIIYSQYLMEKRETLGNPVFIAERLNTRFNFEIINYNNVYYAFPYLIDGAALCGLAIFCSRMWLETNREIGASRPGLLGDLWTFHSKQIVGGGILFSILIWQLSHHQYFGFQLAVWLISIALLTHSFYRTDKRNAVDLSIEMQAHDIFWMASLLALAFIFTSVALEDLPVHIIPDEGNFWETARSIATGRFHPAFFDSGVYTFPVASSIFQGWVLKVFGVNMWGWRFSAVLPAVMTVIPLYLLTREWLGRPAAIVACLMMAGNPYFISFSRLGYNNSQSLFPVTFCLYFLALALRKGGAFYPWLSGIAAGFGFYTYSSSWSGIVTLVFILTLLRAQKILDWKRFFLSLSLILSAWALVYIPRIVYTSSGTDGGSLFFKIFETSFINPFYASSLYDQNELGKVYNLAADAKLFYEPVVYRELLLRGFIRTSIAFFDPYIVGEHFLNTGLAGVITPIFFLMGLIACFIRLKQHRFSSLLVWFLVCFIFLSLIAAFPPRHTHLVAVIPCLAIISAIGLIQSVELLIAPIASRHAWMAKPASGFLLCAVSCAILYSGFQRYYLRMPNDYPNLFEDIVSWVAWHTKEPVNFVYLSNKPGPYRVEYVLKNDLAPHSFTAYDLNSLPSGRVEVQKKTILFLESSITEDVFVLGSLPDDFHWAETYWYRDQYIQGYAVSNFPVDLSPTLTLRSAVTSITGKPVGYVLLGLVVLSYIFGMLSFESVIKRLPDEFILEIGKLPEGHSSSRDFYIKIRFPLKKASNQLQSPE